MKWKNQLDVFRWVLLFLMLASRAVAGTFSFDFDSSLPPNANMFGNTTVADSGDSSRHGVLKLTSAKSHQVGGFIIDSLDEANAIVGFTATFKALMGGGRGGDGFSFCFAPDLPDGILTELGDGSGLIVTFDGFKNSVDKMAPAIRVYWQKNLIGETEVALRTQRFVDVLVQIRSDGTFHLGYDGNTVFTNLPIGFTSMMNGRFALGARTGGWSDNHWIDDLDIHTETEIPSFIGAVYPKDDNAAPDAAVEIVPLDWSKVNLVSLRMTLDGKEVTPVQTTNSANLRVLQYQPPALLEPGSSHLVYVAFAEQGISSVTNSFSFRFSVNPHIRLSK